MGKVSDQGCVKGQTATKYNKKKPRFRSLRTFDYDLDFARRIIAGKPRVCNLITGYAHRNQQSALLLHQDLRSKKLHRPPTDHLRVTVPSVQTDKWLLVLCT